MFCQRESNKKNVMWLVGYITTNDHFSQTLEDINLRRFFGSFLKKKSLKVNGL